MCKGKDSVTYSRVEGVSDEINVIKCTSVSADGFLANNDINATAAYIEVLGDEPELITISAAPLFWEFFFSSEDERVLKPTRAGVGMKTFVRLAYKSFQMKMKYSKMDPERNVLWV